MIAFNAVSEVPVPGILSSGWTVEIGIGDPSTIPDVALYDTSVYDGATPVLDDGPQWVDPLQATFAFASNNWAVSVTSGLGSVTPETIQGLTIGYLGSFGANWFNLRLGPASQSQVGTETEVAVTIDGLGTASFLWSVPNLRYEGSWPGLFDFLASLTGPVSVVVSSVVRGGTGGMWRWGSSASGGIYLAVTDLAISNFDVGGTDRSAEFETVEFPDSLALTDQVTGRTVTFQLDSFKISDTSKHVYRYTIIGGRLDWLIVGNLVDVVWFKDSDLYGSDDPFGYLLDVTQFVRSIRTRRGRERFTSRFKTGVATVVLDDRMGYFTPPAGQAPLGVLPMRPGRAVQVLYDGVAQFSGFIDAFDSRQTLDGDITTQVRCVDALAQYLRNDPIAVTPEGGGDTSKKRARRLLDHYVGEDGYGLNYRGTPYATLQATAMAQNLNAELGLTADSEGGGLWIGRSGQVNMSSFTYFQDLADAGIRWHVGGANPIKIHAADSVWEIIRVINEAHYSRVGGTEQIRANDLSRDTYGRRTHTRLDLINDTDEQVGVLAETLVQFAGVDRQRIVSMEFTPLPESDTAAFATTVGFGQTILATINTIWGYSYTVPTQCFGVSHVVTPDKWTAILTVDDTLFSGEYYEFSREEFDNQAFR